MSSEPIDTPAEGAATTEPKRSPADFLKAVLGRPVSVRLNAGTDYKGVLACLDGYMNIAMEQTEEYVDGQLKSKYGDCFIRDEFRVSYLELFYWQMNLEVASGN
eukprot:scaffold4066_cov63-Cyclotella_meneghiniana.AAC.9